MITRVKNLRHDIYSRRCMLSHLFTSDLYSYDKYYREKYHLKHSLSYVIKGTAHIVDKLKRLNILQEKLENEKRKLLSA